MSSPHRYLVTQISTPSRDSKPAVRNAIVPVTSGSLGDHDTPVLREVLIPLSSRRPKVSRPPSSDGCGHYLRGSEHAAAGGICAA